MKLRFWCFLALLYSLHSCTVYKPSDVLASTNRLKVYWIKPESRLQPIFMGEDSLNICERFKVLFAGNETKIHEGNPIGKLDFLGNNVPVFECFFAFGTNPWIAYIHERDTIYLQLTNEAEALLKKYKAPSPERFAWLEGTWVAEGEGRPIYEEWSIGADQYPVGRNYSIYGGDTTINEELWIKPDRAQITYVARVLNQNGGKPVFFDWQPCDDDHQFSFVNPFHDFPQGITYKLVSPDSIVAVVKGRGSSFEMGMKKVEKTASL